MVSCELKMQLDAEWNRKKNQMYEPYLRSQETLLKLCSNYSEVEKRDQVNLNIVDYVQKSNYTPDFLPCNEIYILPKT